MRGPSAADVLNTWDAGTTASSAERALILLRTVRPEPIDQLAAMPLGWIAVELLRLRAALLGPTLSCLANCPRCDTVIESQIGIAQLTGAAGVSRGAESPSHHRLKAVDLDVEFRLPTSNDLLALKGDDGAGFAHPESPITPMRAADRLAAAITTRISRGDERLSMADLPPVVRHSLELAILDLDPLAFIALDLSCPACGQSWTEPLDVTEFVWSEVSSQARHLIHQVARLAFAFGWRETEILEMSERRRQRYLDLLPS